MLQRDQSTRAQLDRFSRELGSRILSVRSLPGRVEQGRVVWQEMEDRFYIGMDGQWRPLVPDAEIEYSSRIEAEPE